MIWRIVVCCLFLLSCSSAIDVPLEEPALQRLRGKKVLIAVTSHARFGKLERTTGYWLEEVAHFHEYMKHAGLVVDFVSPKGGAAPMDPESDESDDLNDAFRNDREAMAKLARTMKPDQIEPDAYVAIYFAGGHGTMWDFRHDEGLQAIAARIYERGHLVAAVCHGPAALLGVRLTNGKHLLAGKTVTGFSNAEESLIGLTEDVPFLLQDELEARASYDKAVFPFASYVVVSGRLITGQNPASTDETAKAVLSALGE